MYTPSYLELFRQGKLEEKCKLLWNMMRECSLCPRRCGVNRLEGETGICKAGKDLVVASFSPHLGEEPPLVGSFGSGTIFLSHCNLRCVFCQNYDISHLGNGQLVTIEKLAEYMILLQENGCHNINFVTPTHYTPQIVSSLFEAAGMGLELPVVWNCAGYESLEVINILDGIVDIYMPDIKFADKGSGERYSKTPDYFKVAKSVVKEMHRQVGNLSTDKHGIAQRGLLVRHLVMPNDAAGTEEVVRFIAEDISKETYINIMDQYRPHYKADNFKEIERGVTNAEYNSAIVAAQKHGLHRGFHPFG
ncbi:MAG: radical SAM protein [Candidatus Anammoxibacter sp.]